MISEEKKKIVIENYFKSECNINTTIHDAYVKGFERGLSKALQPERTGRWANLDEYVKHVEEITGHEQHITYHDDSVYCSQCWSRRNGNWVYCPYCGSYNGGGE